MAIDEAALAEKFAVMRPFLDERGWRVYLGTEANALGYGGIAAVARASGASPVTVAAGAAEAAGPASPGGLEPGRSRRAGAGRPRAEDAQPGLKEALDGLLEEGKRGDPMCEITWSVLSLRDIARRMTALGYGCSKDAVARLMHEDGWSLRGMSRVLEGKQDPDRDAQFSHVNARIAEYRDAGDPVISVDAKKKELIGAYYRAGRSWRPQGDPVKVRGHDFAGEDTVRIVPYGIYDIAANRGFAVIGTSHDTAAFAVASVRRWWLEEGQARYPRARRLLVTCDCGGSNAARARLWKDRLAVLAAETGLRIEVCHFPPGTSKWNKIEHAMFCHVTRTWRARPLMTVQDAVAGIAATVTGKGLKCTAVLDDAGYPDGITVDDQRMRCLEQRVIEREEFRGDWNYALLPAPRPAPDPEPARARPGRVPRDILNHAALTGMRPADVTALAAALDVPYRAYLDHKAHLKRGRRRQSAVRSTGPHGSRLLDTADYVLALRLRDHLALPMDAIGALLGAKGSTISQAVGITRALISENRIPVRAAPPPAEPPRTPAALLGHAAAAGIPLTILENGHPMPEHFKIRRSQTLRDTPENHN